MILSKTIIFLTFLDIIIDWPKVTECCAVCNSTYNPPCNMKYPFGDERDLGTDYTTNDTNLIICYDKVDFVPEYGRCPFPPEDMKLADPYIQCPEFPTIPAPGELPVGAPVVPTDALCKSCDVKLTPDGSAVILKCIGCLDFPNSDRPAELGEKDIIYNVYYVEIANYTSVNVQGKENFNP